MGKKKKTAEPLEAVREIFKKGNVVCLTGAGISYESGIPTFRGKGGLWETYDPEVYGNMPGLISVFRNDPEKFVAFVNDFYSVLLKAKPNRAHVALAYLEKSGLVKAVITQNIDNLHQRCGTRNVIELHGNAFRVRCEKCGAALILEADRVREMLSLLQRQRDSSVALRRIFSRYCPRCAGCSGRFRIDIVLFGEMLPEQAMQKSFELIDTCRTLVVVGSSLVVYPAASLPQYAKERGVRLIEINPEPSALSDLSDYKLIGSAADILPELVRTL